MIKSISTARLKLIPASENHIDIFYDAFLTSFESVTGYYRPAWSKFETPPSKAEMLDFLKSAQENFKNKGAFLFSTLDHQNNFIGFSEIHSFDKTVPKARLGYWVQDPQQGNGYATEMANIMTQFAFDILDCRRLEIRNDVRNPASGKIAKKLGYRFLAIFEKNKQGKEGDFWDLEIYDRLNKKDLPTLEIEYDQS